MKNNVPGPLARGIAFNEIVDRIKKQRRGGGRRNSILDDTIEKAIFFKNPLKYTIKLYYRKNCD